MSIVLKSTSSYDVGHDQHHRLPVCFETSYLELKAKPKISAIFTQTERPLPLSYEKISLR